ncbi:geranylgeranylglycerol-phosphate geranylgeranyltransferase [Flavobacterium sp. 3HN19-14]|uniref:geranylgeranylglycerol-phosphate geranylgeranyltransferase n=1 Tax=Flavobacterium sp. 3HN19-14 TaxID=3448133 RepID=UPI003EDFC7D6
MKAFFKLIRYQNLLMIALMQFIVRYGFFQLQHIPLALNDWQYVLLVLATVCVAAAGYVINDVFDQDTDAVNKPQKVIVGKYISETKAYNIYVTLNIIGVGIAFYIANVIDKPSLSGIFIGVAALLYLYASSLKQSLLAGNIIVSIVAAMSIIVVAIFDVYPMTNIENRIELGSRFLVLLDYAMFCFIITLFREIVKDTEDIKGDNEMGMRTLPVVLGIPKTVKIVFALSVVFIAYLLFYVYQNYFSNNLYIGAAYTLLTIIAPLIYFAIQLFSAKAKEDFTHLSKILKVVLFFGVLLILVITLNIQQHA